MASPQEVNDFHHNDDCDVSPLSHHHTLGTRGDQASPGNHEHDLSGLMEDFTLTGAKGGNVALANLITELAARFGFTDSTT